MKKIGMVLVGLYLASQGAVAQTGATYYVAPDGNDSRSCVEAQSRSTPRRSVNGGLRCLRAGETLYVRGGTYPESLTSPSMESGTSWTNKVRIAAYGGETVWLKPPAGPPWVIGLQDGQQYIEFDGINLDTTNATTSSPMGGIRIDSDAPWNSHHIRYQSATILGNRIAGDLSTSRIGVVLAGPSAAGANEFINCRIYGSGGNNSFYGFYIHSNGNLVDGCDIYDVSHTGIQVYSGAAMPAGNILRNNRIHDIVQSFNSQRIGIQVIGNSTLIANNVIYRLNHDSASSNAVAISVQGTANKLFNNTVANNVGRNIDLGPATNSEVKNNIGFGNTSNGVTDYGSTGTTSATNLFGFDAKFVSAASGDFQLQSTSPAVDAGTAVSNVSTDAVGAARPQGKAFDIGAFERPVQTAGPLPPTNLRMVP